MRGRRWVAALFVVALFVVATACGGSGPVADLTAGPARVVDRVAIAPGTTVAAPATTIAVATTVARPGVTQPPPPGLGAGTVSPAVFVLEQKLEALHYFVGQVDEAYDGDT